MAEVVLFHHALGLTPGVVAFADELRRAGHTVHTPDLFDGRTFATIEEGMGYAEKIGFPGEVIDRGARAVGSDCAVRAARSRCRPRADSPGSPGAMPQLRAARTPETRIAHRRPYSCARPEGSAAGIPARAARDHRL